MNQDLLFNFLDFNSILTAICAFFLVRTYNRIERIERELASRMTKEEFAKSISSVRELIDEKLNSIRIQLEGIAKHQRTHEK